MKNLSKSKYTTYCQCPKALWLRIYKPEEQIIDPSVQARFEAGSEVGELAKQLFGKSEDVTSYMQISDGTQRLDLKAMIVKTQDCLNRNVDNIAEAAFSFDGCYCAVDILHKTEEGYAIYEVKSSTDLSHLEVYAQDVAYQKYVLTNCGINVTGTYLVNINSEYVNWLNVGMPLLVVWVIWLFLEIFWHADNRPVALLLSGCVLAGLSIGGVIGLRMRTRVIRTCDAIISQLKH